MNKLFAFAIGARKGFGIDIRITHSVSSMFSTSQEECEAEAMQRCLRAYPASEGYFTHWAIASEVPMEAVKDLAAEQL